jgi:hypothetical protein
VAGALAKHAIQAKPNEQRDECEDDDDGQSMSPASIFTST